MSLDFQQRINVKDKQMTLIITNVAKNHQLMSESQIPVA
jgi:hypothetical protein